MKYNPLKIPKRTILGPGPSSANQRVLNAMSLPVVGYLDKAFFDLLDEIRVDCLFVRIVITILFVTRTKNFDRNKEN